MNFVGCCIVVPPQYLSPFVCVLHRPERHIRNAIIPNSPDKKGEILWSIKHRHRENTRIPPIAHTQFSSCEDNAA